MTTGAPLPPPAPGTPASAPPKTATVGLVVAFSLWFLGSPQLFWPVFAFVFGARVDVVPVLILAASVTLGLLLVCLAAVGVAAVLKQRGRATRWLGWLTACIVVVALVIAFPLTWALAQPS